MATASIQLTKAKSNRPLVKVLFLLSIIVSAFWIASYFPDLILTLILSLFLAFILRPYVLFLEFRLGIRRIYSVVIVFLLLGGILVIGGVILVPIAIERLKVLYDSFKNFPFDEIQVESKHSFTYFFSFPRREG